MRKLKTYGIIFLILCVLAFIETTLERIEGRYEPTNTVDARTVR